MKSFVENWKLRASERGFPVFYEFSMNKYRNIGGGKDGKEKLSTIIVETYTYEV